MKMRLKYYLCILLVPVLVTSSTKEGKEESGSMLTSILKTLSSSIESPYCPGRCFNALAALACSEVVDKPGLCTKPGYRCCKNLSTEDDAPGNLKPSEDNKDETSDQETSSSPTEEHNTILVNQTLGLELEVNDNSQANYKGQNINDPIEKVDSDSSHLIQYSPMTRVKVCRGVCVAKRISNFCEAAIDVEGLCKADLRCCVPANLFDGVEHVPKEFIILNPATNKSQEESRTDVTKRPKPITTTSSSSPSSVSSAISKSTQRTTSVSTTSGDTTTREQGLPSLNNGSPTHPVVLGDDNIPPEKRCKGTCVAGFFAFLCDSIDRNGECPRGGRCCVTQSRPKPQISRPQSDAVKQNKPQRRTTTKPRRRTTTTPTPTTTTTSTPPTTTTTVRTPAPPPPCRGTCLPISVASRCQSPSRLVVASGCREDEICCNDQGNKKPLGKNPPPSRPVSSVPGTLGTFLSMFGAGGNKNKRPSSSQRPPRPSTTTTTTTTPSTTTEAIPECPGTCISPILSFTCFGNAEMTNMFQCGKEKQSCCAPKSAIRDVTIRNEIQNIARNDTVYTQPFQPYGSYGPNYNPHALGPYPHHSGEHPNYPQPSNQHLPEEAHFQPPFFNQPPVPLQPPPPPPPPHHITPNNLHQPIQNHPVPPPPHTHPSFTPPHFDENLEGKHPFNPYHSSAPPKSPPEAPHQPPFPHPSHSNAPFYKHVPTYEQNQNSNYSHTPVVSTSPSSLLTTIPELESESHVAGKYVCGVKGTSRSARVVGGEDSIPGEWCWQVALINSLNQYLCGGALIGTQWVLTAAHCVTNIVRSGDAIYIRVGDHDLTTRFGSPGAQTIPVATTYIHHNHNSQTLDNDIALLKLSSHAELGNGVCLVCLPARGVSQVAGKRCTVSGYGYMGETGPIPLRIREAEIPVVSDNECVRQINAVTEKIFILPASSFCAGGESGHDACQGDGGGPLICDVDNYYELSGLVSWGFGCGRQDVPGVYVKVSSFIGWINQIISVNNS